MSRYKVDLNGNDVERFEHLSYHQTMELLKLYQQNQDPQIKEKLVLSNLKLVLSLVQKYQQRVSNLDDLFQVGVIGLIKAIDHRSSIFDLCGSFDIRRNETLLTRKFTYAYSTFFTRYCL